MHSTDFVTDNTFFIMKDGDVKTYYKTQVVNGTPEILVYDRESIAGVRPLNTQEIQTTLSSRSQEYITRLRSFLNFVRQDLTIHNKTLLANYISAVWEGDQRTSDMLYDKDCSLPEKFDNYMQELRDLKLADPDIVAYFHVVHCEQEVIYPRYSQNWLASTFPVKSLN